jgi:ABC-type multidrug transport system fused ATPase/permease subunit
MVMAAKVSSDFQVSENVARMKVSSTLAAMQTADAMRAAHISVPPCAPGAEALHQSFGAEGGNCRGSQRHSGDTIILPSVAYLPALAADPIVEIDRVSFGYDAARPVLHGVSLRIEPGSVVGIMGQSGCGKTTLLRIIAGLENPNSGTVESYGEDVTQRAAQRGNMDGKIGWLDEDIRPNAGEYFLLGDQLAGTF